MTHAVLMRIARSGFTSLLWCLVAGVLVQNYILVFTLRRVEASQREPTEVAPGRHLTGAAGSTLDGLAKFVALGTSGSPKTLVITFSPGCPACRASQQSWSAIASALEARPDWRVLWLSRDPSDYTREYCSRVGISFSGVLADPTYRTYLQFGLAVVPKMILVSSNGVVEKVWPGLLQPREWQAAFTYLGVQGSQQSSSRRTIRELLAPLPEALPVSTKAGLIRSEGR